MFCPQCGKPLADGARFCGNCGATVTAPSAPPPQAAAPVPPPAAPVPPAPAYGAAPPPQEPPSAPRVYPGPAPGAVLPGGIEIHGLIERIKRILLSPRTEWPVIAAEPRTARDIYFGYVAPLAAVSAIAAFLGSTLIGVTYPLVGTIRTPIPTGLVQAVLMFLMTFLSVFVVAWIVDALAPTFAGQKDPIRALKVTAYAFTASWVASVLTIIPYLGWLAALVGLFYGLYLLYLGLPVLMRSPPDKAIGYTVVVIICTIVVWFIISIVTTALISALGFSTANLLSHAAATHEADRGTDTAAALISKALGGKTAEDQARTKDALSALQKMGEQAQAAEKSAKSAGADPSAAAANAVDVAAAMNAVGTMIAGGKDVQPVDFHALRDMLPASLPGLQRTEASGQSGEAMGMKGSSATASYSDGANAGITVEIADLGSLSGLAGLATKFDPNMEKETTTGYERTRNVSGQLVHERYDRQDKSGETSVLVGSRFSVTVRGHGVDASQLTGALQAVDMARLPKLAAAK